MADLVDLLTYGGLAAITGLIALAAIKAPASTRKH